MNGKRQSFALGFFCLLLLDLLFFIWAPFPRSLFDSYLLSKTHYINVLSEIITRIIYFLLFFVVWIEIIFLPPDSKSSIPKNRLTLLFPLLLSQLLIDAVRLTALCAVGRYNWFMADIFTAVNWFVIAIISKKRISREPLIKKDYILLLALLLLLLAVSFYFDIRAQQEVTLISAKYNEQSSFLLSRQLNEVFYHELRNIAQDVLSGAVVLWLLNRSYIKNEETKPQSKKRYYSILLLRIALIATSFFFVAVLKCALLPISSIGFKSSRLYHSQSIKEQFLSFDSEYLSFFRRTSGEINQEVYVITSCKAWYGGNKLFSFKVAGKDDGYTGGVSYGKEGNKSWIIRKEGDTSYHLVNNRFVVCISDGNYSKMDLKNRVNTDEDLRLTWLFKELLKEGLWTCPEYSFNYLATWDYDFVRPYLERYANNNFSQEELRKNAEIKPSFIVEISQRELSN